MKSTRLILFAVIAAICLGARAQQAQQAIRPVYSAYMLSAGSARLADTYLTPLNYDGAHAAFGYQRAQAMRFSPEKWTMQLDLGISADFTENPVRNASITGASIGASWHMARRWHLPWGIRAAAGPGLSADIGALYLSRNGNNPASAHASCTLDAWGHLQRDIRLGRIPVTAMWQTRLPITGAFFSPDYGQLYYQIYLGDTSDLAHAAWWGNYFGWDNLVCADIHLGATTLRVGYKGSILSTKTNDLVTHRYSHCLVIGIATEWISLRPGSRLPDGRIISAY